MGYAVVGSSSFIVFIIVKKFVNWGIMDSAVKPLIASLLMGLILYLLRQLFPENIIGLVGLIIFGAFSYLLILYLLIGKILLEDAKKVFYAVIKK